MFNTKIEGTENIIEFLKLPVIGLKVKVTYNRNSGTAKGVIIKNAEDYITIEIPNDTFSITKNAILSLELKESEYNYIYGLKNIKEYFEISNKEQLLNKLEQIKNQQKELDNKLENIQKQIDQEKSKELWKPNKGELYYFILSDGSISHSSYIDMLDIKIMGNLNCYKTKEEAERIAFEQLLYRKLKEFAYENNKQEINWNNGHDKFAIIYNYLEQKLQVEIYIKYQNFGQIHFSSKEVVERAIEEFKDDLIRYFRSND